MKHNEMAMKLNEEDEDFTRAFNPFLRLHTKHEDLRRQIKDIKEAVPSVVRQKAQLMSETVQELEAEGEELRQRLEEGDARIAEAMQEGAHQEGRLAHAQEHLDALRAAADTRPVDHTFMFPMHFEFH